MALRRDLMLRKRCYYSARSMYTEKPRDIRTEKKGNLSPKVMEILKVRGKLSRNMWNKYKIQFWSDNIFGWNCRQPPCGAVSWNTLWGWLKIWEWRQPPCGAVSWNLNDAEHLKEVNRQPPCGAVSWNNRQKTHPRQRYCQPPCGAVSLNTDAGTYLVYVKAVSPLAGLWVEMFGSL